MKELKSCRSDREHLHPIVQLLPGRFPVGQEGEGHHTRFRILKVVHQFNSPMILVKVPMQFLPVKGCRNWNKC